jgi:hypothetical protein
MRSSARRRYETRCFPLAPVHQPAQRCKAQQAEAGKAEHVQLVVNPEPQKKISPADAATKLLPWCFVIHSQAGMTSYCSVSAKNRVCLSFPRRGESSVAIWIPACAGMTEPQDQGTQKSRFDKALPLVLSHDTALAVSVREDSGSDTDSDLVTVCTAVA